MVSLSLSDSEARTLARLLDVHRRDMPQHEHLSVEIARQMRGQMMPTWHLWRLWDSATASGTDHRPTSHERGQRMTAQVGEIRDNGGRTVDRYTIEILVGVTDGDYEDAYYIGAGESGNVPNGFFMTVDGPSDDPEIDWDDLPERVQRDVLREIARTARPR